MSDKSRSSKVMPFKALREVWKYDVPEPYRSEDRVYLMRSVLGDMRFCTLKLPHRGEALRIFFEQVRSKPSDIERIVKRWKTQVATGKVCTWNDCPMLGAYFPAFSKRAVDCLRDLLEPNGVLLPVRHGRNRYFAFVPQPLRNVIDENRSIVRKVGKIGRRWVFEVERYVFCPEKVRDKPIFSLMTDLYSDLNLTFVTDAFVQRVRENNLNCFCFEIVFPLHARHNWRNLAMRTLRRHLSEGLPKGQTVSGKRVVVRFVLDNPNGIPTNRQEQQVNQWAQRLDDALWDPDSMAIPLGYLFRVEPTTGSCNVVLQGPDSVKLISTIEPLVPRCRWDGPVKIAKR